MKSLKSKIVCFLITLVLASCSTSTQDLRTDSNSSDNNDRSNPNGFQLADLKCQQKLNTLKARILELERALAQSSSTPLINQIVELKDRLQVAEETNCNDKRHIIGEDLDSEIVCEYLEQKRSENQIVIALVCDGIHKDIVKIDLDNESNIVIDGQYGIEPWAYGGEQSRKVWVKNHRKLALAYEIVDVSCTDSNGVIVLKNIAESFECRIPVWRRIPFANGYPFRNCRTVANKIWECWTGEPPYHEVSPSPPQTSRYVPEVVPATVIPPAPKIGTSTLYE